MIYVCGFFFSGFSSSLKNGKKRFSFQGKLKKIRENRKCLGNHGLKNVLLSLGEKGRGAKRL